MKIRLHAICWNEAELMPWFIRHYAPFVDRIVLVDGNSTDGSPEIALKEGGDKVQVLRLDSGKKLDDQHTLMPYRNELWKEGRECFDWQIVCDVDEFLYHPDILSELERFRQEGITIPRVAGYDMISLTFPKLGEPITRQITKGIRDPQWLDKSLIFNPQKVDINYSMGCHSAKPTGEVVYTPYESLSLLHYKWLSHDYLTKKSLIAHKRRSFNNRRRRLGVHYKAFSKLPESEFQDRYQQATEVPCLSTQ